MKIPPLSVAALIAAIASHPAAATSPGWDFSGLGETHLVVGYPSASGRGEVRIYHDSAHAPLLTIRSPARRDFFGVATAGAGDLDGDGFDDLLVGAPLAGQGIKNHGMVHAYSGATGLEIFAIPGFGDKNYFGRAVAGAGDVNDDGVPDIIVSGWIHSELDVAYGRVYIICGLEGTVLKTITSFEADDAFGYTIVSLGDLNGDGVPEIAVAAPTARTNELGDGAVYIFDLTVSPLAHLTTADAAHVIANGSLARDYFGSVLAYDEQMSTPTYHSILVGSVDPISYGTSPAQFVFSHHKIGTQTLLGELTVPSQVGGDVIPDGKVAGSDVVSVLSTLNQSGSAGMTNPDLDGDGFVTGSDLVIVLSNLGTTSPVHALLADPSPIVTRLAQLTSPGGGLLVEPGEPEPWVEPPCNDDDDNDDNDDNDDSDDNDDNDDNDDGGPGIQPGFPGVNPGNPVLRPRSQVTAPTTDGGDCDDDDTDDDDGGCSGCDIPDPAPDGASCNAFARTEGPKFVGRAMQDSTFYVDVVSAEWSVMFVAPGGSLVSSVSHSSISPTRYQGSATFKDQSGLAELKWVATNSTTGVVVTKCFTVTVVDYAPLEFLYRTFIPCDAVVAIPFTPGPFYFSGDSRIWCIINLPAFTPAAGASYRTSNHVAIRCDGPVLNTISPPFTDLCSHIESTTPRHDKIDPPYGESHLYSFPFVQNLGACLPWIGTPVCQWDLLFHAPLMSRTLTYYDMTWYPTHLGSPECLYEPAYGLPFNASYQFRLKPNEVFVKYRQNAPIPLVPAAPGIDVNADVRIAWYVDGQTGRQTVDCILSGTADEFPAHELYINTHPLQLYDPYAAGHMNPISVMDPIWDRPRQLSASLVFEID